MRPLLILSVRLVFSADDVDDIENKEEFMAAQLVSNAILEAKQILSKSEITSKEISPERGSCEEAFGVPDLKHSDHEDERKGSYEQEENNPR